MPAKDDTRKYVEDQTEDELLENVKDPAVRELLRRRLPGQSKLARAARHPDSYPANPDPRLTRPL